MTLDYLTFQDKNKNSADIKNKILQDAEVNEIKYTINNVVQWINNFSIPVSSVNSQTGHVNIQVPVKSVNGQTGDVIINFPVSSVNGQTGHVNIQIPVKSVNGQTGDVDIKFPVTSVNGQTGDVVLSTSIIENDIGYITTNEIPVSSVNYKTGDVILTMADLINDVDYITSGNIPVLSVNGLTGHVQIDFPVLSVNGLTGHVNLNFPVSSVNGKTGNVVLSTSIIENDSGYITSDDIPISSVTAISTNKNEQRLNGHAKIFVPSAISQIENDQNYYNNLLDFIKIIPNVAALENAQDGYLYVILQEED